MNLTPKIDICVYLMKIDFRQTVLGILLEIFMTDKSALIDVQVQQVMRING